MNIFWVTIDRLEFFADALSKHEKVECPEGAGWVTDITVERDHVPPVRVTLSVFLYPRSN